MHYIILDHFKIEQDIKKVRKATALLTLGKTHIVSVHIH